MRRFFDAGGGLLCDGPTCVFMIAIFRGIGFFVVAAAMLWSV